VRHLEENAAAADVELEASEVEELDSLFAPANVAGDRYAPELMRLLDRD
jgi:diketogulonate reductase-like aldo/keto reductase